jgi:hypothetical protein
VKYGAFGLRSNGPFAPVVDNYWNCICAVCGIVNYPRRCCCYRLLRIAIKDSASRCSLNVSFYGVVNLRRPYSSVLMTIMLELDQHMVIVDSIGQRRRSSSVHQGNRFIALSTKQSNKFQQHNYIS